MRVSVDDSVAPSNIREPSQDSDPTNQNEESSELKKTEKYKTLSTPAVCNLAKQHGIDLNSVPGTGKHGRVYKQDVLNHAAGNKPAISNPNSIEQTLGVEEILQVEADESLYQDKTLPIRYLINLLLDIR